MQIVHSYVSYYQRVYSIKSPFNHHFPMVFLWFSYGFPEGLQNIQSPALAATTAPAARAAQVERSQAPHPRLRIAHSKWGQLRTVGRGGYEGWEVLLKAG